MSDINSEINALVRDPDFLRLGSLYKRTNLFELLAVSHTEMWHSAFIKWLLDPESSMGLGDFPLKRFLFTVLDAGSAEGAAPELELGVGELEDMDLRDMAFETEFTSPSLLTDKGGKGRIDVYGLCEEVRYASSSDQTALRLIIENKVKSIERDNQTESYYRWAQRSAVNFDHDVFVFLTPDESQMPACNAFIQITYQDLCDDVLRPCLESPDLSEESGYLLEQYLVNLGKPLKGDRVMALPNKEQCQRIYVRHQNVLDEIFNSVKGEAPLKTPGGGTIRQSSTTLADLVSEGLLDPFVDELHREYKGELYTATVENEETKQEPSVVIWFDGGRYDNVSPAATAATGKPTNGWTFWSVPGKGKLSELRDQLVEKQASSDDQPKE